MVTKQQIMDKIKTLIDPSSGKTLEEINGVRKIFINEEEEKVHVIIALQELNTSGQDTFQRELLKKLKIELGIKGVKIEYTTLTSHAKGESPLFAPTSEVKFLAIASGKGGVGKSTVTTNIAVSLARLGKKVGVIDADIYGSSIGKIMEINEGTRFEENTIYPHVREGVQVIGASMLQPDNKPIMWRGPMLGKMLEHFFNDVAWDEEIEYILIDLPPGTGDVAIDIQRIIPDCKEIIVTTPHPSASHVAVRAGLMARELHHPILGVIENMAYLEHNGEKINVFGEGGGNEVAEALNTPLIAKIPLNQPKNSKYHSIFNEDDSNGIEFKNVAQYVINYFEKK